MVERGGMKGEIGLTARTEIEKGQEAEPRKPKILQERRRGKLEDQIKAGDEDLIVWL